MKKLIKTLVILTMTLALIASSVISGFASENLEINGVKEIKKNDVVTYELSLADCEEGIVGFQMYIIYDREYLDIVDDSLQFPELSGVVSNYQGDYITFNWTNISDLADFSAKKVLATVDFKVLKGGKTDITYFVNELYGEDITYLKSYTFTYDLAVNDKVKIEDEVPLICEEQEVINRYQGMFVNYVDGKGEENGKIENITRETIMGITEAPSTYKVVEVERDDSGLDLYIIIIMVIAVLLICAIVVLSIIKNVHKRNNVENTQEDTVDKEDEQ